MCSEFYFDIHKPETKLQTSIKVRPAEGPVSMPSVVVKDMQKILARQLNVTH